MAVLAAEVAFRFLVVAEDKRVFVDLDAAVEVEAELFESWISLFDLAFVLSFRVCTFLKLSVWVAPLLVCNVSGETPSCL